MAGNFLTRNLVKYWMLIFDVDVSFAKFVKKKEKKCRNIQLRYK